MAEIPIERKESRNWWPLIIGALVLLALLAYCFSRPHTATTTTADSTSATTASADTTHPAAAAAATTTAPSSDAVAQYMQFVQQRDTSIETEAQHRYTAEGVRRLAAALDQVASANANTPAGQTAGGAAAIAVYADSMRSSIDRLQRSSPNDVHAEDARAAFNAAVSAMTVIGKAEGRTYDVAPMRAITKQLVRTTPLMPQLPIVERFFTSAGEALQALNIPGANAAGSATGMTGGTGTGGTGGGASSTTGTGAAGSGTGH